MRILWKYLRPLRWWVALSLLLAGLAQTLTLIDPLIFGRIIDQYALNPDNKPDSVLVRGALWWLLVAVAVALAARLWRQQIGERDSRQLRSVDENPLGEPRTEPSLANL